MDLDVHFAGMTADVSSSRQLTVRLIQTAMTHYHRTRITSGYNVRVLQWNVHPLTIQRMRLCLDTLSLSSPTALTHAKPK